MNKIQSTIWGEIAKLQRRWEIQDEQERKNNIIITGIKESTLSPLEVVSDLLEGLDIHIGRGEIKDTFRIGREKNVPYGRPIIVKFWKQIIVHKILKNSWKLKDTKIFVNCDYSMEERRIKELVGEKNNSKEKGQ